MKAIGLMAAVALAGIIAGPARASEPSVIQDSRPPQGYLSSGRIAQLAATVPTAPTRGSPTDIADRAASARLTALEDTDRWLLATRHAELRPSLALAHFDCALGFRVAPGDAPRLVAILAAVLHDANEAAELAKARAMRPRPVGDDPERRSCQVITPAQRATASHPSGSASVGVAYGVVLAALAPEQAAALMESGRQIAASRMICGMHYPSDVADGVALGEKVAQDIIAAPSFRDDASAAREEIAAARSAGRTSPGCAAERAALALPMP